MDKAKKEMLIAGLIGLFMGLGLGFLATNIKNIKLSASFKKPISNEIAISTEAPSTSDNPKSVLSLSLTAPDDESVTKIDTITVEGKTDPKATIIVSSEDLDVALTPTADGSFSTKVMLTPEENQLVITAYKDSQQEIIKRLVIYDKPQE